MNKEMIAFINSLGFRFRSESLWQYGEYKVIEISDAYIYITKDYENGSTSFMPCPRDCITEFKEKVINMLNELRSYSPLQHKETLV